MNQSRALENAAIGKRSLKILCNSWHLLACATLFLGVTAPCQAQFPDLAKKAKEAIEKAKKDVEDALKGKATTGKQGLPSGADLPANLPKGTVQIKELWNLKVIGGQSDFWFAPDFSSCTQKLTSDTEVKLHSTLGDSPAMEGILKDYEHFPVSGMRMWQVRRDTNNGSHQDIYVDNKLVSSIDERRSDDSITVTSQVGPALQWYSNQGVIDCPKGVIMPAQVLKNKSASRRSDGSLYDLELVLIAKDGTTKPIAGTTGIWHEAKLISSNRTMALIRFQPKGSDHSRAFVLNCDTLEMAPLKQLDKEAIAVLNDGGVVFVDDPRETKKTWIIGPGNAEKAYSGRPIGFAANNVVTITTDFEGDVCNLNGKPLARLAQNSIAGCRSYGDNLFIHIRGDAMWTVTMDGKVAKADPLQRDVLMFEPSDIRALQLLPSGGDLGRMVSPWHWGTGTEKGTPLLNLQTGRLALHDNLRDRGGRESGNFARLAAIPGIELWQSVGADGVFANMQRLTFQTYPEVRVDGNILTLERSIRILAKKDGYIRCFELSIANASAGAGK